MLKLLKQARVEHRPGQASTAEPRAGTADHPPQPTANWASFSQRLMGRLDSTTQDGVSTQGPSTARPGLPKNQG